MKKKIMSAAAMLCIITMLCACSGQNYGFKELISVAMETGASQESEIGYENQEEAEARKEKVLEEWAVEPLAETMYVRVDGCKVKKGPGEEYETAGTLVLLEELWVTGKTTDENGTEWYQIAAPKTIAHDRFLEENYYIRAEYVKA